MWSKCVFVLLLITLESRLICGEYFRKDYKYVSSMKNFYKINTVGKTWTQANIGCLREGATFFFPENKKEAKAVMSLWNEDKPEINAVYVGIANWNVEEILETVDGRQVSNVYHNWAVNEPNNAYGNNSCVVMQKDGSLKVASCSNSYPYMCKKKLSTVQWNDDCNLPDPSYKYSKEFNRCYKFHLDPQNWTDAYQTCLAEESYLAIINSPEEDQYFINITAAAPKENIGGDYLRGAVHLGFKYLDGIWETIKGVPLNESGFSWDKDISQPDGEGSETCGSMFYTGQLNDIGCWQKMFFICEHELEKHSVKTTYKYEN